MLQLLFLDSADSVASDDDARRLRPSEVHYLAMEGGGGKGFAYLGALQVLEELGVMGHVDGFAGASAGAITALLVSTGMTSSQVASYMATTNFDKFFDVPEPRTRPVAGYGGRLVDPESTQDEARTLDIVNALSDVLGLIYRPLMNLFAPGVIEEYARKTKTEPFKTLSENWPKYLTYMGRDMGLFSGHEARREWDRILQERMASAVVSGGGRLRDITFEQHCQFFHKRLIMTGSNLSTGRTELFSAEATPRFPVADAVRISMSLPFIYKPYVIDETRPGWPPCGTYVDGGLWNNLPFREFDGTSKGGDGAPSSGSLLASAVSSTLGNRPQTLALRLSIDPVIPVRNLGDLVKRVATFALFGTGESQVLSTYVNQTILLDTEGLDLVNFSPPIALRERAIKRARRTTYKYFSKPIPEKDKDPADDMRVQRLMRAARACV